MGDDFAIESAFEPVELAQFIKRLGASLQNVKMSIREISKYSLEALWENIV